MHEGDFVGQYALVPRPGRRACWRRSGCRSTTRSRRTTTPPPRPATSTARTHRVRKELPRRRGRLPGRRRHPDVAGCTTPARSSRSTSTASRLPLERGQPGLDPLRHADLRPGRPGRRHALHVRLRGARHGDPGGAAPGRPRRPGRGDLRRDPGGARRGRRRPRTSWCTCSSTSAPTATATGDRRGARGALPGRGRPRSPGAPALLRPEFLLEVFPTAVLRRERC